MVTNAQAVQGPLALRSAPCLPHWCVRTDDARLRPGSQPSRLTPLQFTVNMLLRLSLPRVIAGDKLKPFPERL